jgi:hypothetical protein
MLDFAQLNKVAMIFTLLYNGLPDSIKVAQMLDYVALQNHHMFLKCDYAQSSIRICSISEFAASIRIAAYCKQVQGRLPYQVF